MSRALLAAVAALLLVPASSSAALSKPDPKRDKGCAKGARYVETRAGTFRVVYVLHDGEIRAAACDTRYGKAILLLLPGSNRNDGTASVVKRAGSRAILDGRRTHPRGPTSTTFTQYVDFKRGRRIVLERPITAYAFLRKTGTFGFVQNTELHVVGLDGREDVVGFAHSSLRGPLVVNGTRATFGPSSDRASVDWAAMSGRLRTCQPGPVGTASAASYASTDDATVRIWSDRAGVTRACPPKPTGELRLPCLPRDHAIAGARLVIHCVQATDTVAILDTVARTLVTTIPIGAHNLLTRLAVSSDGLVAYSGRRDGAGGPRANVLWVVGPDGANPQLVGEAGYDIRNVRFTAPRTLAWAEINRADGPDVNKTASF